jgi:uncharacterized protein DUF4124
MKIIFAIVALMFVPVAGAAFKCVDEQGRTHIGDAPPEACARVEMYETSRSGHVIRRIDPTPTPEQARAREEEARARREIEKREAEQQRYDKALLATFASENEFDVARERNIDPLKGRIDSARERISQIDKRLVKIDEEIDTYLSGAPKSEKRREVPHSYILEKERLGKDRQSLMASIALSEKEIQVQRQRFDRDKGRWIELKSGVLPTAQGAGKARCGDKVYDCPASASTYTCLDSATKRIYKAACTSDRP